MAGYKSLREHHFSGETLWYVVKRGFIRKYDQEVAGAFDSYEEALEAKNILEKRDGRSYDIDSVNDADTGMP